MAEAGGESGGGAAGEGGVARYCRRCGYDLRGATEERCPKCGRGFDPWQPRTTRRRPKGAWLRREGRVLLAVVLLVGAAWGWFYWGWASEQAVVAALKPQNCYSTPMLPQIRQRLGRVGFVLDRVNYLVLGGRTDPKDFPEVAGLTRLQVLALKGTRVTDLGPLSGLSELRWISIETSTVTDLRPLAGLPRLDTLDCTGSRVTDVTALAGMKSLRLLSLPKGTVTEDQVDALREALPDCEIRRE